MSEPFDFPAAMHAATHSVSTQSRYSTAAWALAASVGLHAIGFASMNHVGLLGLSETPMYEDSTVLQATLLPAKVLDAANDTALQHAVSRTAASKALGLQMEYPPQRVAKPVGTANRTTNQSATQPAKTTTPADTDTAAPIAAQTAPEPLPAINTTALAAPTATPDAVETAPSATPNLSYATPSPSPLAQYQLPAQVTVRYEAHVAGPSGKSVLNWKKTQAGETQRFEAQLSSSATILFKTFEHRYSSRGVINTTGLMPLSIEERRTNGSTVATTVDPENKRVVISSKEGFLPFDPLAKDLVSLMLQLSIYTQTQPLWLKAGTAQDFTVYRPSGLKRWRFQSMGVETIALKDQLVSAVYIKRVPLNAEPDFEDQHHFWLDPKHYGFPVKMRIVDNKGLSRDIVMTHWQE